MQLIGILNLLYFRGGAYGFRLEILGKLQDFKSNDNKKTLLYNIVEYYFQRNEKGIITRDAANKFKINSHACSLDLDKKNYQLHAQLKNKNEPHFSILSSDTIRIANIKRNTENIRLIFN